jgi:hypothetical protein
MLLMIAIYFDRKYNRPSMEANCVLSKMQVDNNPFPVNAIDLQGAKVLVRPKQAESTKGKNVIIDEKGTKA